MPLIVFKWNATRFYKSGQLPGIGSYIDSYTPKTSPVPISARPAVQNWHTTSSRRQPDLKEYLKEELSKPLPLAGFNQSIQSVFLKHESQKVLSCACYYHLSDILLLSAILNILLSYCILSVQRTKRACSTVFFFLATQQIQGLCAYNFRTQRAQLLKAKRNANWSVNILIYYVLY